MSLFAKRLSVSSPESPRKSRRSLHFERLESRRLLSVTATFHGDALSGAVLQHVQVESVFIGSQWQTDPNLAQDGTTLNNFLKFITNSSYMGLMSEYYEVLPFVGNAYVGSGAASLAVCPRMSRAG